MQPIQKYPLISSFYGMVGRGGWQEEEWECVSYSWELNWKAEKQPDVALASTAPVLRNRLHKGISTTLSKILKEHE